MPVGLVWPQIVIRTLLTVVHWLVRGEIVIVLAKVVSVIVKFWKYSRLYIYKEIPF